MKKCIVKGCDKYTKKGARPGSDDSFYCETHKWEYRKRLVKDSRNVIRNVSKEVLK